MRRGRDEEVKDRCLGILAVASLLTDEYLPSGSAYNTRRYVTYYHFRHVYIILLIVSKFETVILISS